MGIKSKGEKTRKCFGTRHHRPELETRLPLFEGAAAKTPRRVRHIKPDFELDRTRPVFAYISRRKLPFFVGKNSLFHCCCAKLSGRSRGEGGGRAFFEANCGNYQGGAPALLFQPRRRNRRMPREKPLAKKKKSFLRRELSKVGG